MALAAAQVVDALAARVAPQAAVSGRVKTSRAWPWSEAELPACRIFVAAERVEFADVSGVNRHTLQVDVQYSALAVADLDDTLHALAASGQTLLFASAAPYNLQLTGIIRQLASEGEAAVGRITLQVAATFFVDQSAPETIL